MSERDDDHLTDAMWRALRESDELVPTSEAEVERAEALLDADAPLPPGLHGYRPLRQVAPPAAPRGGASGYIAVATLAALAAAAALTWLRPPATTPVTSAGSELVRPSASAAPPRLALSFENRCQRECCGGSECKTASAGLNACPSGLRCVACAADNVNGGPYRLRVGSVIPTESGERLLPRDAALELCVISPRQTSCLPALGEAGGASWRLLNDVTPLQDLLAGLTVELRKQGETTALASWRHPVAPTPDILCKGLYIQLAEGGDALGKLSVFIEATHFVELGRAAAVPQLLASLTAFDVSGTTPRIFETSKQGDARFVLVLGPFDKPEADALRWQALDHGHEASISHGLDFVGNPRPAP